MNIMPIHKDTYQAINTRRQELTKNAIDRQYVSHGETWASYKEVGYRKSLRDSEFHFTYLAEAIGVNNPVLFMDYVSWMKVFFISNNFPPNTVVDTLEFMKPALEDILPPDQAEQAKNIINTALKEYANMPDSSPTYMKEDQPYHELAAKYLAAVLEGSRRDASQLILDAVEGGVNVRDIYLNVFQVTQLEIGRLWHVGQISVAQEHFCTATTQMIISQLYPRIFSGKKNGYNLVATTVGGDLHEMGMRMVADFFELDGWDTYFLGANTPAESIVKAIEMRQADIVAVSTTLPAHVGKINDLVAYIKRNSSKQVKIMVGGYPFNISKELWKTIGADASAQNADEAVKIARSMV